MIIVLLEPAFLFFVLTSGRPLPVTTFFVFSKPLCSHFAAQIVIREFSAPLQKRCLSLSKGFPLQPKFAAAAALLVSYGWFLSWRHFAGKLVVATPNVCFLRQITVTSPESHLALNQSHVARNFESCRPKFYNAQKDSKNAGQSEMRNCETQVVRFAVVFMEIVNLK